MEEQRIGAELARRFANCQPIADLLVQRGIDNIDSAERFFHPSLRDLHDPFLMPGMDAAVERLNRAMGSKERIMVYGDYDVDGCTAVALVFRYLQNFYSELDFYIPTRYDEGYGITRKCIDEFADQGVKLVIILDCGIKANEEIEHAASLGIDFIICDHHKPGAELPKAAAILNPKLEGSTYPCPHLSGCGVGYKLMQAFSISNGIATAELECMLDLVAVSIAADIVPIIDENRVMAYMGLKRLNSNPNVGLRAIIRTCGLGRMELTINDVIFKIGPRINASKELDKRITEEANAILEERGEMHSPKRSIVIYNKHWHKGIIGIVASRLTELYYKPSVVLTLSNGLATGSSRSVQGFDIYKAIESTSDLLENFGGHTYAVGLSLKEENIPAFTSRFEDYVAANILPEQLTPQIDIDAFLSFSEITPEFVSTLRLFNPFGPGNRKPTFCSRRVKDFGTSKLVGRNLEHIKLEMVDDTSGRVINGIAFNMASYFEHIHSGKPFNICFTIEENKHQNSTSLQLLVKQIRAAVE